MPSSAATESAVAGAAATVEHFRRDYAPPPYSVREWFMDFSLDESDTVVTSTMKIVSAAAAAPQCADLVLDGEEISLQEISLNGTPLSLSAAQYEIRGDKLVIPYAVIAALTEGASHTFEVKTVVLLHPDKNLSLSGLYKSGSSNLLSTQCEAMGFRRITFSLDRPDVLSVFKVRLEADKSKYPVLLSNGNHLEEGDIPGTNRHFSLWEDPFPKPSYLFALVAGDLASIHGVYTTKSGRVVRLGIYSDAANVDKLDHAMYSLKASMAWDEETFGLECDLDIYNVVATNDFNMGAMENKGLNIFNSAYVLADAKTATDTDYENVLGVIGHEYFHNWTGNRVTVRDWFQLTLKEGLTVFRDQWFSADLTSAAVKRIEDVRGLRSRQFAEDAGPMAHPIRPDSYISMDNFYTSTVYSKGAEIIGIYKTLLGEEGFKRGLRLYIDRHDGTAVTCDDFLRAMGDANGRDLSQMERWYSQAGTPVVTLSQEYDAEKQRFVLRAAQYTPTTPGEGQRREDKQPVLIPLVTALLHPETGALLLTDDKQGERVLLLTESEQEFVFENIPVRPVVSTLRGFSAPVNVEITQSDEELVLLMAHDTDAFNRWDASNRYYSRLVLDLAASVATEEAIAKYVLPAQFVRAIESMLTRALQDGVEKTDCSLLGYALQVPDLMTLMNQLSTVDIDAVYHARMHVKREVARLLRPLFEQVYAATTVSADHAFAFNPQEVGRRRLHNTCLDFLAALGDDAVQRLAKKQFDDANCMTDKIAAMHALASLPGVHRDEALLAFHRDAAGNALVLNKWFAIQASADYPTLLEDVKALKSHPDFLLSNPNRARSLLSTFGLLNHFRFHEKSGAGYAFLAESILELDKINPQVAARLLAAFAQWKKFDAARRELMQAQLERIKSEENLSPDTFEIVSRYLK